MAEVHKHILVTGYISEAPGEDFVPNLNDWFRRLVAEVGMNILFEPQSIWCKTDGNEGLTGVVGLDTSHSSIHFWPTFYTFDLYSCKDFSLSSVVKMLSEFGTQKINYMMVHRVVDGSGVEPVIEFGDLDL